MGKVLKDSSKKNSTKLNTAPHNNASKYSDTGGLLEHSTGRGVLCYKGPTLQKTIPGFLGILLILTVSYNKIPFP